MVILARSLEIELYVQNKTKIYNLEGILLIRSRCIFLNEIDQSNKKPLK